MPVNFENNFVSVKFTDSLVEFGEVAYKNMKRYDLQQTLFFTFLKGYLRQILLGPFPNILSDIYLLSTLIYSRL